MTTWYLLMVQLIHIFGSVQMQQHSKGMKTIAEVIDLRNTLLMNFENALIAD